MMNLYKLHTNPEQLYGYDRRIEIPEFAWEMTDDKQRKKMASVWIRDAKTAVWYAFHYLKKMARG